QSHGGSEQPEFRQDPGDGDRPKRGSANHSTCSEVCVLTEGETVAAVYDRRQYSTREIAGGHRPPLQCLQFHRNPVRIAEAQQLFVIGRRWFGSKLAKFTCCLPAVKTSDVETEVIDARRLSGRRRFESQSGIRNFEPD